MSEFFRIIHCQDWMYFKCYLNSLYSKYNIINCDTLDQAAYRFNRKSFLDCKVNVYVIDNLEDLVSNIDIIDDLIKGKYKNKAIIVYKIDTIDKRSKLFKKYSKHIEFLDISMGYDFISSEYDISKEDYDYIISKCNNNFSRTYFEINKSYNLSECNHQSIRDSFDSIYNISLKTNNITTFELVDLFVAKDISKIKNYLSTVSTKDFDFGLLVLLYNKYHDLFVVKSAEPVANTQNTGLTPFIIKECKKYIDLYSIDELKNILNQLFNLDYKIKSGTLNAEYAYDFMLTRLLS